MTLARAAGLLLLTLVLPGCGGGATFAWRGVRYELPEQALDAQRRDLEQEAGGVTPVLEEDRLGGAALVALPMLRGLKQALRPGAVDDAEGRLHYDMGLVRGELRALAQGLVRAGLFERAEVVEEEVPAAVPAPPGSRWRIVAAPNPASRQVQWSIEAVGAGQAAFSAPDATSGPGRFDAFVQAASAAGRSARAGPASTSGMPAGWAPFTLPPEGGAARVRVAVPAAASAKVLVEKAHIRSWLMDCSTRDLHLALVYDLFAPGVEVERGLEASLRDRLRDDLPAKVVHDEDPGGVEKWVLLLLGDGRLGVARIRQAGRGLAAALVVGPERHVLRPDAPAGRPLREQVSDLARTYLDSLRLE